MHFRQWKRREFITLLGGAAAWPVAVRAQQRNWVRRIGVLMGSPENDAALALPSVQERLAKTCVDKLPMTVGEYRSSITTSPPISSLVKARPRG
jgi:hypothetical protein